MAKNAPSGVKKRKLTQSNPYMARSLKELKVLQVDIMKI